MKMAWPWPGLMVVKQIAQVLLEDLEDCGDLERKRWPEEEGACDGGEMAESDCLD